MTITLETLAAVYRIAKGLIFADGDIDDHAGNNTFIGLDRHFHRVLAGARKVDKVIAGQHVDQDFPVKCGEVQVVVFRMEIAKIGNDIYQLAIICKLVDLQRTVPREEQESFAVKGQLELIVGDLIFCIVRDIKIVSVSLVVMLCKALVIDIEKLGPGAAPGLRPYGQILVPVVINSEKILAGKAVFVDRRVILTGLDHVQNEERGNNAKRYRKQNCKGFPLSQHGFSSKQTGLFFAALS